MLIFLLLIFDYPGSHTGEHLIKLHSSKTFVSTMYQLYIVFISSCPINNLSEQRALTNDYLGHLSDLLSQQLGRLRHK